MTAEAIVIAIAGIIQSPLQELFFRNKINGRKAALLTIAISFILSLLATWVTGGFAETGSAPDFTFQDPSPLLGYLLAKLAPVYALSQMVFSLFSKEIHDVANTTPTPE